MAVGAVVQNTWVIYHLRVSEVCPEAMTMEHELEDVESVRSHPHLDLVQVCTSTYSGLVVGWNVSPNAAQSRPRLHDRSIGGGSYC